MGCRLSDFKIGQWEKVPFGSKHVCELAPASTKLTGMEGFVYKVDGRFKGFVFSREAAIANAMEDFGAGPTGQPVEVH